MGSSVNPWTNKIYVVCPRRSDFLEWCYAHNANPHDQNYVKISYPIDMLGRKIKKGDVVDYYNVDAFDYEVLEELKMQIAMRSPHEQ